jgi:hypothetical protein
LKGNKEKKLLITILGLIRRGKKGELQMYNPKLPNREREEIRNNLTIFLKLIVKHFNFYSKQLLSKKPPIFIVFLNSQIFFNCIVKHHPCEDGPTYYLY